MAIIDIEALYTSDLSQLRRSRNRCGPFLVSRFSLRSGFDGLCVLAVEYVGEHRIRQRTNASTLSSRNHRNRRNPFLPGEATTDSELLPISQILPNSPVLPFSHSPILLFPSLSG